MMAHCPAHGEWFGIQFKLGTFMPLMRSSHLRDQNDVTLQNATRGSFWLMGRRGIFLILRMQRCL